MTPAVDQAFAAAIAATLDRLRAPGASLLVQSPPGTGKTTRIPPQLLNAPWAQGRGILLLEPRRMAARAAARFLAHGLGEQVGGTIGLRTRLETRVGPSTRLTVATYGVYLRLLQEDPALEAFAGVIFDECHERTLAADLALTFTQDARATLRPDLRLVLLSATVTPADFANVLPNLTVVTAEAPSHPVEVHYLPPRPGEDLFDHAARVVRHVWLRHGGTALVFLPGMREIQRLFHALADLPAEVLPLHSSTPPARQDQALRPAPGERRVILATSIAETSLTIPGVTVVVDCGLARVPRYDPGRDLTTLATVPAPTATIQQRTGRAGRTGPGTCYRLWDPKEEHHRPAAPQPEILEADLTRLALEVAAWGTPVHDLAWLTPPPAAPLQRARTVLTDLGALDAHGRATEHGRKLLGLPLAPRLGHMVLSCPGHLQATACALAALLEEGGALLRREHDLRHALAAIHEPGPWRTVFHRLRRALHIPTSAPLFPEHAGFLTLLAYPDRLAGRMPDGSWRLTTGTKAVCPSRTYGGATYLVAPCLSGSSTRTLTIHAAAPVDIPDIQHVWGPRLRLERSVRLEGDDGRVVAETRLLADTLPVRAHPETPSAEERKAALTEAIRRRGLSFFQWTESARQLVARVRLAHSLDPEHWPAWDDASLMESLEHWLGPNLMHCSRLAQAAAMDLSRPLQDWLATTHGYDAIQRLDCLLPQTISTPAGAKRPIDYTDPSGPRVSVKLQEMFGATQSPRLAHGRVPITLVLLSPAHRPLHITQDLAAFWAGAYREVRKEMRGRYPKHAWPEDPLHAAPSTRTLK